ncbi:ribosomal protein S12 methylthiotransferase [Acrasis kona]|uniref:Ribosomal protein S12 methylthiotransferase n=1 Tax=Acrasis kona TaxID=1008807 RepID=A0AAW2Z3G8_9EUKA
MTKPHTEKTVVEDRIVTKAPIINKVVDQAVVDQVIDKKFIEIHKQDIITEIHEQPIIEIHEKPLVQTITEKPAFNKLTRAGVIEDIEAPEMTEAELLAKTEALIGNVETLNVKESHVNEVTEKELIKRIEIQPIVELHEQARITEVHEQKIVEVLETPVMRVIHEKPIVRRYVDAPEEPTVVKTSIQAFKTEEFKHEQGEGALTYAETLEKERHIQFTKQ